MEGNVKPHYDRDFLAAREKRRLEAENAKTERRKLEEQVPYKAGYVLGQHFSSKALVELAELLIYAEFNFGPPYTGTFLKELMEHRPIGPIRP
jgi:hypothetical protein